MEFKLQPKSSISNRVVETDCTVETCNTEDCENQGESHSISIPLKRGVFLESKDKNIPFTITNSNNASECDSRSLRWSLLGARRGMLSVRQQNSRQVHIYVPIGYQLYNVEL